MFLKLFAILFVVALLLAGAFAWLKSQWDSNYIADRCEEKIKRTCKPGELNAWATSLITKTGTNDLDWRTVKVPDELMKIWKDRKPSVLIREERPGVSESYVYVSWGSGMLGHWGMFVGSTNFVPGEFERKSVRWQPGIYFWRAVH